MRRYLALFAAFAIAATAGAAHAQLSEGEVRDAWSEVCRVVGMEELPLSFEETDVPNAWVTAGESVTVTRGLMAILVREEEIFGVLSHEAGHAYLDHYSGRVKNATGVGLAAAVLSSVFDSSLGSIAVGLGANLATAGYSREQEVEADDFATDMAFKGGHDPTGLYNALERIILRGGETSPSGFNSHPPDERRLGRIEYRIHERAPNVVIRKVLGSSSVEAADTDTDEVEVGMEGDESEIEKWRRELGMPKKNAPK